jgi:HAD superfamily hydrolase (TIGR01549 family)
MKQNNSINGVIFDLDGTLIDSNIDFKSIADEIGYHKPGLIEYLNQLPLTKRLQKYAILEKYELKAAQSSRMYDGANELLEFLSKHSIKTAAVTRNSKNSWNIYQEKHNLAFDAVITREDAEIKPSPLPFELACLVMDVPKEQVLSVGDYKYEIVGSKRAGLRTALILHNHNREHPPEVLALSDYILKDLFELRDLLDSLNS